MENQGQVVVQLLGRHWVIANDRRKVVATIPKGSPGVIGYQPVIKPGEWFEYYSGIDVETPGGEMSGSFQMVAMHSDRDPEPFDAVVSPFALVVARKAATKL